MQLDNILSSDSAKTYRAYQVGIQCVKKPENSKETHMGISINIDDLINRRVVESNRVEFKARIIPAITPDMEYRQEMKKAA